MKNLTPDQLARVPVHQGIIDSHIHLDSQAYIDDVPECLARAAQHGVTDMLLPSTDLNSSRRIATLLMDYPQLLGALGIHPHQAASFDPQSSPAEWHHLLQQSNWVAIGETGLECHYDFCPLDVQQKSLEAHLELARQTGLPLIFHCRLAEQTLYEMLSDAGPAIQGVVHCFTGGWTWAKKFLDLGFYLGIGGLATLPKAADVHEVAAQVPGDRWLLETDGPYLSPVPYRGYRNESCLLPLVVQRLAELRHQDPGELVAQSTANARRLFKLKG